MALRQDVTLLAEPRRGGPAAREPRGSRIEPRILCWNCRRLTPFDEDACRSCGAAFGGSTGGAYSARGETVLPEAGALSTARPIPSGKAAPPAHARNLQDLLQDLKRVGDVSPTTPGPGRSREQPSLFQCPSCGRFVDERATSCLCGVHFSDSSGTFPCPGCDALVPVLEDDCPVCGVHFEDDSTQVSYLCPKCGTPVSADALRCKCGVWFED